MTKDSARKASISGGTPMAKDRHCIFCWESDEPTTLQPLFAGPGALPDVEPIAWVHKDCLQEYAAAPDEGDPETMAAMAELEAELEAEEANDDVFADIEDREDMTPAELWERAISDLVELEERAGGPDKGPVTAIIEKCLDARRATAEKDRP
jgi:hypothetical protein